MEKCAYCDKGGQLTNQLRRCSRCKAVSYCSHDCQSRHWPQHKVKCLPPDWGATRKTQENLKQQATPSSRESLRSPRESTSSKPSPSQATPGISDTPLLWQRARSRAESAFPGHKIIDDMKDWKASRFDVDHVAPKGSLVFPMTLRDSQLPSPSTSHQMSGVVPGVAAVLRLASQIYHPFRPEWILEDIKGKVNVHVRFEVRQLIPTQPHNFRFDDLQKGHFLCVKDPELMVLTTAGSDLTQTQTSGCDFTVIIVRDANNARVFPPH